MSRESDVHNEVVYGVTIPDAHDIAIDNHKKKHKKDDEITGKILMLSKQVIKSHFGDNGYTVMAAKVKLSDNLSSNRNAIKNAVCALEESNWDVRVEKEDGNKVLYIRPTNVFSLPSSGKSIFSWRLFLGLFVVFLIISALK